MIDKTDEVPSGEMNYHCHRLFDMRRVWWVRTMEMHKARKHLIHRFAIPPYPQGEGVEKKKPSVSSNL
jgi:hypothetical protein